jgi:putative membrane protein insertion efficiency factor
VAEKFRHPAGLLLRGVIWLYRHSLSYFLGRQCRFLPSCSAYADEAIRLHGPMKGSMLALHRFCRCHPWGGSGFDPVPELKK